MLLPWWGERGGQMDVCRGKTTGRVDSIYNDALPVTNPAQRTEEVIITPLMAAYFCVVIKDLTIPAALSSAELRL